MTQKDSILKALMGGDSGKMLLGLYLYTRKRLSRMFWRGENGGPIPEGLEIEDFVHNAIVKGLTEVRKWNPDNVSLIEFFCGIISSDISCLANKYENKMVYRIGTIPKEDHDYVTRIYDGEASRSDWPDTCLIERQEEEEKQLILRLVADNPIDSAVVKLILNDGLLSATEIAAELQITVNEVYKSKRRIRKKVSD